MTCFLTHFWGGSTKENTTFAFTNNKKRKMKSFNDKNPIGNYGVFSDEFLQHLKNEGFDLSTNDAYSLVGKTEDDMTFLKRLGHVGYLIGSVYVCSEGIGVDLDYDCGGNSDTYFVSFEEHDHESAYDLAVDYVNSNR